MERQERATGCSSRATRRSPTPTTPDTPLSRTVADLAAIPGWSPAITPHSATHAIGTATAGTTTYCIANNPFAMGGGWQSSTVVAAALVLVGTYATVVDPVIYVTDDLFRARRMLDADDTVHRSTDRRLSPGNRALFSWPVFVAGSDADGRHRQPALWPSWRPLRDYELAYTQALLGVPAAGQLHRQPELRVGHQPLARQRGRAHGSRAPPRRLLLPVVGRGSGASPGAARWWPSPTRSR